MEYDLSRLVESEKLTKDLLESCKYLKSPDYQSIEKLSENITELRKRTEEHVCVSEYFAPKEAPNDFKKRYTSFMINGFGDKEN